MEVHRLRYRDRVTIEFLKDGSNQDIPGPWLKWAAFKQDRNFQLEKSRIVLSKSRFLLELPEVRELHFSSAAELDIDSGVSDLIDKFAADTQSWDENQFNESPVTSKTKAQIWEAIS